MISDRLKKLIFRELQIEEMPITDLTTADTIPGWDSLSHTRIITAIEEEYRIRFKTLEILRLKNLGELQAAIDRKLA
ncbi:MAG: acyl carrier protein [Syntrophales bacterium LBB04]|nr:acyl carrier protein [Syntrophales bacterium LBB04]